MGLFEETVVKAKEIADITGKKAGDILNVSKLRVSAAALRSQISKLYEALGRTYYDMMKDGEPDTVALESLSAEIAERLEELAALKADIARAMGKRVCGACAAPNDVDSLFCRKCGQSLTPVE